MTVPILKIRTARFPSMECLFCRIAAKEIPAAIRYEDHDLVAFDDIKRDFPTHVLVVPKRHIPSVRDLTADDAVLVGTLVLRSRAIAEEAGIAETGYKLIVNCGRDGGQVVPHLHLHLIGGKPIGGLV